MVLQHVDYRNGDYQGENRGGHWLFGGMWGNAEITIKVRKIIDDKARERSVYARQLSGKCKKRRDLGQGRLISFEMKFRYMESFS